MMTITNAISFDVEEYFHVHAFKDVAPRDGWDLRPSRVVASTHQVLSLLRRHRVRGTFFILGWVAERHPSLVSDIAAEGHEIASHGFAHEAVHGLSRQEFRDDLHRANDALRNACPGVELLGYRAPSFSINQQTPWAFEELAFAGFQYDSSVSPATLHDNYGVRGASRFAYDTGDGVLEIPPTTVRVFGHNLPAVGGGHFRLAPLPLSKLAVKRIQREGHPVVSYFHPWEFDPDQPRVKGASAKSRFRHYTNLAMNERKLESLLSTFAFDRMDRVFGDRIAAITAHANRVAAI